MSDFGSVSRVIEWEHISFVEPQSDRAVDAGERGVIFKRGIAEMFHPVEIIVECMIDAVVTSKAQVHRSNSRMIKKGTEVGTGAQGTEGDFAGRFGFWVGARSSGIFLLGMSGALAPDFVNAASGARVSDFTDGVADEFVE